MLEGKHRKKLLDGIERKRKEIQNQVERKIKLSPENTKNLPPWFDYEFRNAGEIVARTKGRGGKKRV